MKVLDSVRVLEIGGLGPGPFCAMHLADLGADVISVVREAKSQATTGPLLNRGKRSVSRPRKAASWCWRWWPRPMRSSKACAPA